MLHDFMLSGSKSLHEILCKKWNQVFQEDTNDKPSQQLIRKLKKWKKTCWKIVQITIREVIELYWHFIWFLPKQVYVLGMSVGKVCSEIVQFLPKRTASGLMNDNNDHPDLLVESGDETWIYSYDVEY